MSDPDAAIGPSGETVSFAGSRYRMRGPSVSPSQA